MANPVIEWAKDNPLLAGGAALAVVVVVMLVAGGGGGEEDGGSGGMGAAGVQAYYAAVANQAQAGAVIQTTQIKANAETNRALIAATYGIETNRVNNETERLRIGAEERLGGRSVDAWREVELNRANQEANVRNNSINLANAALRQRNLGKAQRGAIVQAAITGQVVPVQYKPINPGNSTAAILNSGANLITSIGGLF